MEEIKGYKYVLVMGVPVFIHPNINTKDIPYIKEITEEEYLKKVEELKKRVFI